MNDFWDQLLIFKTNLMLSPDRGTALARLLDDEVVIEVYADDIEQAMFIVAANRMADLLGIVCFRMDIEGGKPQMVFGFGSSIQEAKARVMRFYEARQRDAELGLESE